MQWVHKYKLFLFDFDGVLVDTERLHHQAYIKMCAQRGFHLSWDFQRYSQAAHHKATGLRDHIYAQFPTLYQQEPNWQVLYEEKKRHFIDLISHETVPLLPGVSDLLLTLEEAKINRCVVTHSSFSLIKQIREQHPVLNSIPHWITREDYFHPKPHPECYQLAIDKFAQKGDLVIGFEDSLRGIEALLPTGAISVLICHSDYSCHTLLLNSGKQIYHYSDFPTFFLEAPLISPACNS